MNDQNYKNQETLVLPDILILAVQLKAICQNINRLITDILIIIVIIVIAYRSLEYSDSFYCKKESKFQYFTYTTNLQERGKIQQSKIMCL